MRRSGDALIFGQLVDTQSHDNCKIVSHAAYRSNVNSATIQRSLAKRQKQQVYVDALQNARGKTIAAAFSARAKDGATVSMPLTWKQVEKGLKISDFTIKNAPGLIKKNGDAWKNFFDSRQSLKLE